MTAISDARGITIDEPAYFRALDDFETSHWWPDCMWAIAAAWLGKATAKSRRLVALDLGCGTGRMLRKLVELPGVACGRGLEIRRDALASAREANPGALIQGSAASLPIKDSCIDILIAFDVVQHLDPGEDRVAFREIARVLRPGGWTLIRTGAPRLFDKTGVTYRLSDLADLCVRAGLCVSRSSYANAVPALADEYQAWRAGRRGSTPFRGLRPGSSSARRSPARFVGALEAFMVGSIGLSLPWGHSSLVLARKPREGAS